MDTVVVGIVEHLTADLQQALDAGYALTGDKCVRLVMSLKMFGFKPVVRDGKVELVNA